MSFNFGFVYYSYEFKKSPLSILLATLTAPTLLKSLLVVCLFLFFFFFVFVNLKFDGPIFCYIGKNAAQYPLPRNSCASYVDVTNYLTIAIIRIQLNRTEVHEILQPKRTLLSRDL